MRTGCELRYRRQVSRRNPELHRLTFQLTCPDGSIRWTVITDQDIPRELGGDDSNKQDKTLQPVDEENHFVIHATPAPGALTRLLPLLNTLYHDAAKRRVTITKDA